MKKLILFLPLFAVLNLTASNSSNINKSLEKELRVVDLEGVSLIEDQVNFVNVSLSVDSGKLKIEEMDCSSEALKSIV